MKKTTSLTKVVGIPVSILINVTPGRKERNEFFENYCLPMIKLNNPCEIIINDDPEPNPAKKWNDSFFESSQPYVQIISDDFLIKPDHVGNMFKYLQEMRMISKNIGYVYPSGYKCFPGTPESHPGGMLIAKEIQKGNMNVGLYFNLKSREFDAEALKKFNYIDGSCLWVREHFVPFDQKLPKLLDWDVALNNLIRHGITGAMCPDSEFMTFNWDAGLSRVSNSHENAVRIIKEKYGLP